YVDPENPESQDSLPFYLVYELNEENKGLWKILPAPLVSQTNLNNLEEDVTDYFLTLNLGKLVSPSRDPVIFSFFFGQFRKYNNDSTTNDYDSKSPFYRIFSFPSHGIEFANSSEAEFFIKQISSGDLYYQKISMNGGYLRIYEQSFAIAVFSIIFVLTSLLVLMNLLVFPNIIVYVSLLFSESRKDRSVGLVYDEATGEPVRFASLRIFDSNGQGNFITQKISDIDGRYYG